MKNIENTYSVVVCQKSQTKYGEFINSPVLVSVTREKKYLWLGKKVPSLIAQSVALRTSEQEVAGSIPGSAKILTDDVVNMDIHV